MISDADTAPFNRLTRPRTQYSRRASRAPEVPFSVLAAEFLRAPSRMRAYSREKKQLGVTEPQEMLDEALEDEEGRLEHAENIVDAAILLRVSLAFIGVPDIAATFFTGYATCYAELGVRGRTYTIHRHRKC